MIRAALSKRGGGFGPRLSFNGSSPMPAAYVYLLIAIVTETIGTMALQLSQQFTRPLPSLVVVAGYGLSFWFMALALKYMPVGIVYAIWSGLGIVFIALIAYLLFGQKIDLPAALGMGMIIAGIVVIQVFSKASPH
ncbi:MAG: multidrug efflux SMR transporter [Paracoccaceae bacterium]